MSILEHWHLRCNRPMRKLSPTLLIAGTDFLRAPQ